MSRTGNDGAKKARAILREHYSRGEPEGAVEALITDLREYCKRQGLSFDHLARRSAEALLPTFEHAPDPRPGSLDPALRRPA